MTRQEQEELVCDGFILAIRVVQSQGIKVDELAALQILREVAAGTLTLYDSAQKETAILEGHIDPMSDEERAANITALDKARPRMNSSDVNLATMVLSMERRIKPP